ncbi:small membrane protein [Streptomyces bingchenggensis BCW-1]|uniref:Small membrane protein n=1 Tax=Streptomyces bingchenggensis (strain BCW-1) TaxID=749414 RepID=D7BU61_STRBB|nr:MULTISPECIES: hypothetical protein [Streptomyces]ADI11610.1 small membrane protein [Streptomyces bingchenggensis BCW-1]
MLWPMLALALAFTGIAVLAVPAVRVFVEVRRLARQVGESSRRITRAAEDLERATAPLGGHVDALRRGRDDGLSSDDVLSSHDVLSSEAGADRGQGLTHGSAG